MLHMITATAALWAASWALCQWGKAWYWREKAAIGEELRAAAFEALSAAKHDINTLRRYLFERERDNMVLRGCRVEISPPAHLGHFRVEVTLTQWRLIEDFLRREGRIQRRPLDPTYLVVSPDQHHRMLMEMTPQDLMSRRLDTNEMTTQVILGNRIALRNVPVQVQP